MVGAGGRRLQRKNVVKANMVPYAIAGYQQHWAIPHRHLHQKFLEQRGGSTASSLPAMGTAEQGQQAGQGQPAEGRGQFTDKG